MYFSDKTYGSSQTALGNCYRFAISKMLIAVQKLIVLFIIIFGTLSFPIGSVLWQRCNMLRTSGFVDDVTLACT